MAKNTIYVVVKGRNPGIYGSWTGENGAAEQVQGFAGALFRGFARAEDAAPWIQSLDEDAAPRDLRNKLVDSLGHPENSQRAVEAGGGPEGRDVVIYTDGGAIGNPGPGGYGAVLRFGTHEREISGGYRLTTNNRMELMACIAALEALNRPCSVILYSDSTYVVNGVTEGWAERWRRHGWERANGKTAENVDLWARLLELLDKHDVEFRWVKGHAGRSENERADQLATEAARQDDLPPDTAYEAGETNTLSRHLL